MHLDRFPGNPILTRESIPEIPPDLVDPTSVFNPGAIKYGDKYLLILRVQNRGRRTFLLKAESDDGVQFEISSEIVRIDGLDKVAETIYHIYDPRITAIDGTYYLVVAIDLDSETRLATIRTDDFERFEFLGMSPEGDVRNGVLFPERIDGKFMRLERPNRTRLSSDLMSGSEIVLSESSDLIEWNTVGPVMSGNYRYWDELVGSGPPPVKTKEGWLHIYHGIAIHLGSQYIYQAGVVLLDLDDPTIVKARSSNNILEPRELYELTGQVPNVVFPSGMIVDHYDENGFAEANSKVNLYYGAADTSVALATTTVGRLLDACGD